MTQIREVNILPPAVEAIEIEAADFLTQMVSKFAPGLERSVGAVQWHKGEMTGVDWTAEGFLNGLFLVVCFRPSTREVSLLIDTTVGMPSSSSGWKVGLGLAGSIAIGAIVGVIAHSPVWGLLAAIGIVVGWVWVDIARLKGKRRRAEEALDEEDWRRRFHKAVDAALGLP